MHLIWFLGFQLLGFTTSQNVRGPERRIISVPQAPGEDSQHVEQPWLMYSRKQFMRDILAPIHPLSPINRDAWIKSGLLKDTPADASYLHDTGSSQDSNLPRNFHTNAKARAQSMGKTLLLPPTVFSTKKLAKANDSTESTIVSIPPKTKVTEKEHTIEDTITRTPTPTFFEPNPLQKPNCYIKATIPVFYYLIPIPKPQLKPNIIAPIIPSQSEVGSAAPLYNKGPFYANKIFSPGYFGTVSNPVVVPPLVPMPIPFPFQPSFTFQPQTFPAQDHISSPLGHKPKNRLTSPVKIKVDNQKPNETLGLAIAPVQNETNATQVTVKREEKVESQISAGLEGIAAAKFREEDPVFDAGVEASSRNPSKGTGSEEQSLKEEIKVEKDALLVEEDKAIKVKESPLVATKKEDVGENKKSTLLIPIPVTSSESYIQDLV